MTKPMTKRFWEIKAAADKSVGEVYIYGAITSYRWDEDDPDVTADSFQKDLKALGDIDTLNVYINSPGGSVFQGQAIYSILKRHAAKKNVYIDGIAASIASLIAMAGDTIYMPGNAMMMVHQPSGGCWGNAVDMRKMADSLDKIGESMITAYMAKLDGKTTEAKLIELLDAESWLTAQECLEYGFCDELIADKQVAACVSPDMREQYLARYTNIPDAAKVALFGNPEPARPGPSDKERLAKESSLRRRLLSEAAVISTMLDPSK